MKTSLSIVAAVTLLACQPAFTAEDSHAAYEDCAKACNECRRLCEMCASHCARMITEGKKEHLTTLQTCQDCAAICSTAAGIVARKGPFADTICTACAEACKICGDHCEKLKEDPMMQRCAEECRKCEKSCRSMLKHIVITTN